MTFTIITHVNHGKEGERYFAYAPYVREMNMWLKYADKVIIVAPAEKKEKSAIDIEYLHPQIKFIEVPGFDLTNVKNILKALIHLPVLFLRISKGMRQANHIHLRCPGNMGLLGAMLQIFFPKKTKTAKYAGNWDWNSKQPWSYRMQQRLLRNTFLTKNMTALVYGEWPDRTKNIRPFFTASYSEKERIPVQKPDFSTGIRLAFVGTLSSGKSPLTSLSVLRLLKEKKISAHLTFCGEGAERKILEQKISEWKLEESVTLLGNVNAEKVKQVLQEAHFLVFISKSEGWPKAVVEAMWWGCVPITTSVSCVPQMLGHGERGFLVENNPGEIAAFISTAVTDRQRFDRMSRKAMDWSRGYTLEKFEKEVQKLMK